MVKDGHGTEHSKLTEEPPWQGQEGVDPSGDGIKLGEPIRVEKHSPLVCAEIADAAPPADGEPGGVWPYFAMTLKPRVSPCLRRTAFSSCDATPSLSVGSDVLCRVLSPVDACSEKVEAARIAPASREALTTASTCVANHLSVGLGARIGAVPFGLSCHEFNPSRNRRLSLSDPTLSSPAESRGRRPGARP